MNVFIPLALGCIAHYCPTRMALALNNPLDMSLNEEVETELDYFDKIKRQFCEAVTVSVLLYGCTS